MLSRQDLEKRIYDLEQELLEHRAHGEACQEPKSKVNDLRNESSSPCDTGLSVDTLMLDAPSIDSFRGTPPEELSPVREKTSENFKFLTENLADIVWTMDLGLRTSYVSPSIQTILGFTPEQRRQQSIDEMITPESLELAYQQLEKELFIDRWPTSDPDRSVTIDVEAYHADGSTLWMENRVKAIRGDDGSIIGLHGCSRDITRHKEQQGTLQMELEQLKNTLKGTKRLRGWLPICAACKKIRDDENGWRPIETYVEEHSEARFTHSICPECAQQMYPENPNGQQKKL